MIYLGGELYLDRERWRLDILLGYTRYPDTFWGLGNDAPDDAEEDFTPRRTLASLELRRLVAPALYVGGHFEYARRTLLETEAGGLLDTAAIPGVRDGSVVSAGLSVTHDDRDNTTCPRRGGLRDLELSVSGGGLGGEYAYRTLELEILHYRALSERSVLAAHFVASARSGDPPFGKLGQLGGGALLRGYYEGRFRDRNLLAGQVEWRARIWRRLGGVVFAGAGEVAHDVGDFTLGGLHASGGLGIRFLLDREERLNMRADLGFGAGSSGLYMSLGEAF
jgi:outer membrane protein assembly factor BamA